MPTRHRASTSMYSLTFCVRIMLPERHQWKPAVQADTVVLRMPPRRRPVTGQPATATSHIRRTILRTPPVTRQSPASIVRTLRRAFALCRHIAGWTQACNYVAIATQPCTNCKLRPIVHNYGAASTTPPSYIRVRAVMWAYGRGHTHTHTHTGIHTDARDHDTFCVVYDAILRRLRRTQNVIKNYAMRTDTRLTASVPEQTEWVGTRKVKSILDYNKARNDGWQ